MKIKKYREITPAFFDDDHVKGVSGRVAVGKNDGADNFCMRVFEIKPGGHTPKHSHSWEHELFFHKGKGEILCDDRWVAVGEGTVAFIPGDEEHQIRNNGDSPLTFACLIPSGPPEL